MNDVAILRRVITENAHQSEIEQRHCYSLYIGECLKNGVDIQMDAAQVYSFIQGCLEDDTK